MEKDIVWLLVANSAWVSFFWCIALVTIVITVITHYSR